jgi:hypothetical protein
MAENQIKDGSGESYLAGVNIRNQILARSIAVPAIHEAALRGDAFSWTAVTSDIDAGDCALVLTNNNDTRWLVISRAYVRVDVGTQVKFHLPAAFTATPGTAVVGVNLNTNYANTALATALHDDDGVAFVAANTILTVYCPVATNAQVTTSIGQHIDFQDAVILGYGKSLAADVVTEPGAIECTFVGYYIDSPI